jgi:UDP-N-acetylmuramoyl-tripeptide--D-alanyl-D-alanine ligase
VIEALPADGTAVFPADDAFTPLWRQLAGARRVRPSRWTAAPT